MQISLPKTEGKPLLPAHFPTTMQAFVFRNWSMVKKERIARVLETSVDNVERIAADMGLGPQEDVSLWNERGYITIIRANWHLLSYEQLLTLLDRTEDELALILKEEDFLSEKLGGVKPICEKITYKELNEAEKKATLQIKAVMQKLYAEVSDRPKRQPFDFYTFPKLKKEKSDAIRFVNMTGDASCEEAIGRFGASLSEVHLKQTQKKIVLAYAEGKAEEYHMLDIRDEEICLTAGGYGGIIRGLYRLLDLAKTKGWVPMQKEWEPRLKLRCIYPFSASYQDMFEGKAQVSCPDSLLEEYARIGINGIWLPALLYRMTEFPFAPELSEGWENRIKHLRDFTKRAASYGIKLYLYLNEPRSMPLYVFEKHPDMMGTRSGDVATMCIESEKTVQYLENAMAQLCENVPELGGFFLISLAESLTHCKSKPSNFYDTMCPRCRDIPTPELVNKMHDVLYRGMKKTAPHMAMLFFDWCWSREDLGMNPENAEMCIKALPEGATLLCQRETGIPFCRGGMQKCVTEYTLSVDGVSSRSLSSWKIAKESGHGIAGKMQINNSWECSTVPYLPVFQRNVSHLAEMTKAGINCVFFSWTLGGYPSPNIQLVSELFFSCPGEAPQYREKLRAMYGDESENVWKATAHFSRAMGEYPFDKDFIYQGPSNGGVANLFYEKPTGFRSTMTCYTYDNLKDWARIYPEEVLENQYMRLCTEWEKGLPYLQTAKGELRDIAYASYIQFRSSYHQIRFIRLRDAFLGGDKRRRDEILSILEEESVLATEMYAIMLRQPSIGFEAANHYYISNGMVAEKLINLTYLREIFKEEKDFTDYSL